MNERLFWMIQIEFRDETLTECSMATFRRELQGTGIEVDTSYQPTHVGRGRFVGRGSLTKRAARKLQGFHVGFRISGGHDRVVGEKSKVTIFEEHRHGSCPPPAPLALAPPAADTHA